MALVKYLTVSALVLILLQTSSSSTISRRERDFEGVLKQVSRLFQLNVTVLPSDVTFYYYNRQIQDGVPLNLGKFDGSVAKNYNHTLKNYFISHGSGDSYKSLISTKQIILDNENANVFLIDWSKHAAMFYTVIVTCVPRLTDIMGEAVSKLCDTNKVPLENINLIGHSLGAHVVGGIGAHLNGRANYIIGLDPAAPLFQNEAPSKRLDASDAKFVQILHTNGGFQGMMKRVGDADFYPNGGGMNQPGCGSDLFGACAHARAMAIFRESLARGGFCARLCSSYKNYKNGDCDSNVVSHFGEMALDKSAQGSFYFDTNDKSPYATGKC